MTEDPFAHCPAWAPSKIGKLVSKIGMGKKKLTARPNGAAHGASVGKGSGKSVGKR